MTFSEKEKKYIVDMQDRYTIGQLQRKMRKPAREIYQCYSDMVDSGEYVRYYEKLPFNGGKKKYVSENDLQTVWEGVSIRENEGPTETILQRPMSNIRIRELAEAIYKKPKR